MLNHLESMYKGHNKYILTFCFAVSQIFSSSHSRLLSTFLFPVYHSSSCNLSVHVIAVVFSPITSDPLQKRKTTTISVEVKKSQHKYIIGPKGNTLQEILEATGVSVEMPPLDSGSETIILRGEPDKLGPALTQVYAKVRRGWRKTSCYFCLHYYFRAENTCMLLQAASADMEINISP